MGSARRDVPDVLTSVERSLRHQFGVEPARASITFVGVEPVDVLRFDLAQGNRCYVSIGMSRQPMVGADVAVQPARGGPRAELLLEVRNADDGLWRKLALLAAAPAVEGVVYRDGMTVELSAPLVAGSRCTGVLVQGPGLAAVTAGEVEVEILRLVPATSAEMAWCRVHGSAALRDRWDSARSDLLDLGRPPAPLG